MNGNNLPLVSILVFSYNHEKYIGECLESIINQDYLNIELIVIDDCSPDNTWDIVMSYHEQAKNKLTKVNFILKDVNKGLSDSKNIGIGFASGKYILMCASDDALAVKQTISKLVNKMQSLSDDYAIVTCDNKIIDEDGKQCYWDKFRKNVYSKKQAMYESFGDFLKYERTEIDFKSAAYGSYLSIINGNYISNGYLTKLDVLKSVLPLTRGSLEDWETHLKISKKYQYKYLDEQLFSYRWHGANTMNNQAKVYGLGMVTFREEKKYCYENGYKKQWLKKYMTMLFLKNIVLKSSWLYNFLSFTYKKLSQKK